ncbi:ovochymase-2-like [Paramacrobiotus metropolitanus]|uniref:ovochymase-2-like n=1 Tax=Paramacrobiotus metropolitanus TaxID=2943436 RepID=UPI002445A7B8|nr:ovochymase-2-like [Paramacrobiotus metropolitanus]
MFWKLIFFDSLVYNMSAVMWVLPCCQNQFLLPLVLHFVRLNKATFTDIPLPTEVEAANVYKILDRDDRFFVKSPRYPDNYPDNTQTAYWLQGNGRPITLDAKDFQLEAPDSQLGCRNDYLVIWDLLYPNLILKVACGNALFSFKSYSDSVMMLFYSDSAQNFKGFNFSVSRTLDCGENELVCPSSRLGGPLKCIDPEHVCDGVFDCADQEDEICTVQCGLPSPAPVTKANTPAMGSKNRIVGGTDAVPNAWPWQVDVSINNATCGGSLLAPRWVITAGHCCKEYGVEFPLESYVLRVGYTSCQNKEDGQTVTLADKVVHPNFTESSAGTNYDYCILFLNEEVQMSPQVQPICLPRPGIVANPGDLCTATGCGNTMQWTGQGAHSVDLPNQLQVVNLMIVNGSQCDKSYDTISPQMLCASMPNKDACQGDSGGPLVCQSDRSSPQQYFLQGITSYGFGCASGKPGVFADARRMLPFLIQTVYDNKVGWNPDVTVPKLRQRQHSEPSYAPRVLPGPHEPEEADPENTSASDSWSLVTTIAFGVITLIRSLLWRIGQ